jgi:glutamate racemase
MNNDIKDLPIGIFDSGLGGLTVVRAVRRLLPEEKIIYLGDSARVPYGTRSAETVERYANRCAEFLLGQGLKMLVVACNTVSAVALPTLRKLTDVPVLGVITAGARSVAVHGSPKIGVIGTAGTINSGAYPREIAAIDPDCEVHQRPAPLLVPLAEEGWISGNVPLEVATRYIEPLTRAGIEVLLLGCTHYPLLVDTIRQALEQLGSDALVIDSATAMAADVQLTLEKELLSRPKGSIGELHCFVTDLPASFTDMATRFLGEQPETVKVVDV